MNIWHAPDYLGEVENRRTFYGNRRVCVDPRYEDLNSDLPICITQDFLLIQSVTGLDETLKLRAVQ